MNTILCNIQAFSMQQQISIVDETGKAVQATSSSLEDLDRSLFSLAEKNNAKEINLTGSDTFCTLVKYRIDNLSKSRYGIGNELRVSIIN